MRVLVVGSRGRQGRRYCSILNYLGVDYTGTDLGQSFPNTDFTHAIVATPTNAHEKTIFGLRDKYPWLLPILVEKPVVTSLTRATLELDGIYAVNQYAFLPEYTKFQSGEGLTAYDYYQSGADGLLWDCISLVGLANGRIELKNDSPVWKAQINGVELHREDMDTAYVVMLRHFVDGNYDRFWGPTEIKRVTEKVCKELPR